MAEGQQAVSDIFQVFSVFLTASILSLNFPNGNWKPCANTNNFPENAESVPAMYLQFPGIGSIIFISETMVFLNYNILGGDSRDCMEKHGYSGILCRTLRC